jgi:hypothetical protein
VTPLRTRAAAVVAALGLASLTALSAGASASAEVTITPAPSRADALASAGGGSSPGSSTGTSLKQAAATTDRKAAVDALATVRAVLAPKSAGRARADLETGGVEATMALRDLALRSGALGEDDRAEAAAYLARPTDGNDGDDFTVEYGVAEAAPVCTPDVCVHYVTAANENEDAPPPTDTKNAAGNAGANGIPDYVDTVVRVMTKVHDTYRKAGYREPRPDDGLGGDDRIDIYLAEIGSRGAYGYCTTDQDNPGPSQPQVYDRWAYCVLDNDYAGFPNTPLENIQVTAAHEYFHATQYAYDAFEDPWFLEATATWAEDEVYDEVDDNVQYLKPSPLTAPFLPLDYFISAGNFANFHYGTWSFFRFLTEKYRARKGGMPVLMLDLMKKVDGSASGPDQYSWQAVQSVLAKKGTTAAKQFLAFSVANRDPRKNYDEGKANKYPVGPLAGSVKLTKKKSRTNQATVRTEHLSSATYRITPRRLAHKKTKLKVTLDMAPRKRGSMAAVTVFPTRGKTKTSIVRLDGQGDGSAKVAFSSTKVRYVEVTLANTSGRFTKCFEQYTPFSCYGLPKDDRQRQKISARVVR